MDYTVTDWRIIFHNKGITTTTTGDAIRELFQL